MTSHLSTGYYLGISLIVLGFIGLVAFFIYTNKKYPERKTKKDPIFKAVLIVGGIFALSAITELLGGLEEGWLSEHAWWFAIALFILIAFYTFAAYFQKKPKSFDELYNKYALNYIKDFYHATPYTGNAYVTSLMYHTIIESNNKTTGILQSQTTLTSSVCGMLIQVKAKVIFNVLIVLNIYNGYCVKMVYKPKISMEQKLMEQDPINVYENVLDEFEEKEEAQPQQATL